MFFEIGIGDVVDVFFMSILIYFLITWFKRTRAASVLTGIIITGFVYLLATLFGLRLTASVLQGFFAVILLALVIIFHEEIRRFFEQIAEWGILRQKPGEKSIRNTGDDVEVIVRTAMDFAREKIGALIVIQGKNMLGGSVNGGIFLDGRISEEILKSIFDVNSVGHDGAVILEGNKIVQFGAHLPLSKNFRALGHTGTRHAAALGITESTDALCIVVSEERGTVSVARHGQQKELKDGTALNAAIVRFHDEINPKKEQTSLFGLLKKNAREKIIAVCLSMLLWFVQVYGSGVTYKTVDVPVRHAELPAGISITEMDPKTISVTFSGSRRKLYFMGRDQVKLTLNTLNLTGSSKSIRIKASDLVFPENLKIENIDPHKVDIKIKTPESFESPQP
jgi:uncharacterized protein (TIGR00159 family)